jgi:WD40 repeat protein
MQEHANPVTAVTWRAPTLCSQNILLAASGYQVIGLHVPTSKVLSATCMPQQEGNVEEAILSMASNSNNTHIATGGSRGSVHLFDSRGTEVQHSLQFGKSESAEASLDNSVGHGHSNRVFAVCWHPEDPNLLFSGGWDKTVQVCLSPFFQHLMAACCHLLDCHCLLYLRLQRPQVS